jgi:hypothetical protein
MRHSQHHKPSAASAARLRSGLGSGFEVDTSAKSAERICHGNTVMDDTLRRWPMARHGSAMASTANRSRAV